MKATAVTPFASRLDPALKPNQPTHSRHGADIGHRQRVRCDQLRLVADTLAQNEAAHQAGNAGVDVDDRAAGEVERALAEQEPVIARIGRQEVGAGPVPDHVRDRIINDRRPQHDEQHQRPELHPLRKAADDQRRSDAGEGHLEDDVDVFRNVDVVGEGRRERGRVDPLQEHLAEPADIFAAAGEGHRIAPADPHQSGDADDRKDLHQHGQHVLRAHEAAVEQGQRRHGHHQHQRGADEHPRRIALVDHVRGRSERRRRSGRLGECRSGRDERSKSGNRRNFRDSTKHQLHPLKERHCSARRCGFARRARHR